MPTSKFPWFETGLSSFGLLIGLLVGLSISPIVSTIVGLLFAFIGGSIIVLIKGRSEDELSVIGRGVTAISLLIIVGVALGVYLRMGNLFQSEPAPTATAPYTIDIALSVDDIKKLGARPDYAEVICHLIKSSAAAGQPGTLTRDELAALMDAGVDKSTLLAMIDPGYPCGGKSKIEIKTTGKKSSKTNPAGYYLYTDEDEAGFPINFLPLPNPVGSE